MTGRWIAPKKGPATSTQTGAPTPAPSERGSIDSFIVMDVMRAAAARERAGLAAVHMEVGQPGTPAPRAARAALLTALDGDPLGYTLALGNDVLRGRIARLYREWYDLELGPERVIVTVGSSGAFILAFLALFDAGARVALPSPGYPCYRHILSALGCQTVALVTGPENRWMPEAGDIAALAAAERLDGVLIASPANPTGTMMAPDRLAEVCRVCADKGIWFISDEIYHGLTYERPAATTLAYSDDAIVINSFSKYFSMTGWRVGWMVVPERLVRTIERLQQNLFIAPPAVSQVAALGAFDGFDELEANRLVYAANRALLSRELPRLGFDRLAPADGAFYLYADISRWTDDSLGFARQMLAETGVAATPGVDFDACRGGRYLRFSYSGPTASMEDAVSRLAGWKKLRA